MKRILPLLLLAVIPCGDAYSQTFNWARQAGANLDDFGYAVTADTAGNSYVTGSFKGTITFPLGVSLTSTGGSDIFVAKYNSTGAFLWARQATGPNDDQGNSIGVDGAGNVYVTGVIGGGSVQFATQSITSTGVDDIFVAKYNAAGFLQWVLNCGGVFSDVGNGIAVRAAGNFYVTGVFHTAATFKSTFGLSVSLTSNGTGDIFVASYNTNGVLQWVRGAGGANWDAGQSVSVDVFNNCYVTGHFESSFTWGSTSLTPVVTDVFVTKYGPTGNVLWVRTVYGPSVDVGRSISVDSAGGPYVFGNYSTSVHFSGSGISLTSPGNNQEMFLARYNPNGSLLWARSMGGAGYDRVGGVCVRDTTPYVTGLFVGTAFFGSQSLTSSGSGDVFVARYDPNGTLLWVRKAGGTQGDVGNGIGVDGAGHAYITGAYQSNPASFPGTISLTNSNPATYNFFVAEIH